jgi:hypothetical protein
VFTLARPDEVWVIRPPQFRVYVAGGLVLGHEGAKPLTLKDRTFEKCCHRRSEVSEIGFVSQESRLEAGICDTVRARGVRIPQVGSFRSFWHHFLEIGFVWQAGELGLAGGVAGLETARGHGSPVPISR